MKNISIDDFQLLVEHHINSKTTRRASETVPSCSSCFILPFHFYTICARDGDSENKIHLYNMSKKEPTIDQYTQLKNQLTQQILKKQELDSQLQNLEETIYEKENDYFNESTYGNIVKGFDNFAKSTSGSNKKKMLYSEDDHIFSMSSATFVKSLMKRQGINTAPDLDDWEDSVEPANHSGKESNSNSGTPSRKRKGRFEDIKN